MKNLLFLSIVAAAVLAGCSGKNSGSTNPSTNAAPAAPAAQNNAPPHYNLGNNPAMAVPNYVAGIVKVEKYSEKTIDVSYLNQDIQLYNAQEGHNPATLEDLVPNYVGKLPQVPQGYKLSYDADKGVVTVVKAD
ncbi:MAG: hypothetical protein KGR98_09695 [Verrucomicrobia bacterium]|nr:hypothetical protein [Verrucomicrobiota bacterium]MDE3098835.1 hypothetical protein [Verrucomicrobiota bacterium]